MLFFDCSILSQNLIILTVIVFVLSLSAKSKINLFYFLTKILIKIKTGYNNDNRCKYDAKL